MIYLTEQLAAGMHGGCADRYKDELQARHHPDPRTGGLPWHRSRPISSGPSSGPSARIFSENKGEGRNGAAAQGAAKVLQTCFPELSSSVAAAPERGTYAGHLCGPAAEKLHNSFCKSDERRLYDLSGKVVKVSGPLVVATGLADANMSDVVRVGPQRLIGEILTMNGDSASIQVYEETSGLGPGAEVVTTGAPMSVELGPGMIEGIYDGIQRPLEKIVEKVGACITRGVEVSALDHEKKWEFTATVTPGDQGHRR